MQENRGETFERDDWDDPWPLTPRTRFMVWRALCSLDFSLDLDLNLWPEHGSNSTIAEFPRFTHGQPLEWWQQTQKATRRMAERMRTGVKWNPRTPAEEAALYLASGEAYIDAVKDDLDGRPELREQFDALPDLGELDFHFDEVVRALTESTDIELIFQDAFDGLGDPEDPTNRWHGIRDYRPAAWHRMFDLYQREPQHPSYLS